MTHNDDGHLINGTKDRERTILSINRVLAVAAMIGLLASALISNNLFNPNTPWVVIGATVIAFGLLWQFKLTTDGDKERAAYMAIAQMMLLLIVAIGMNWWSLAPLAIGVASYIASVLVGRVRHDPLWMRFLLAIPIVSAVLASLYLITAFRVNRADQAKLA